MVASEIQNLAVQSDEAATEIQKIVRTLQDESEETVQAMRVAETLIKEQQEKLDDTKMRFDAVNSGITKSKEETEMIRGNADVCDSARSQVMEVITNLSAISQQNAASTEQTTASMQELNATINMLAEVAGSLKTLSGELNQKMGFFRYQ